MPQYENAGTYTTYYKLEAANYTPFFGSFTTTINPKAVTDPTVTFGSVEDQKWTGEKITPKLVVTDSATGNILAEGIDYTLAYVNNIDEGTATVTITGISNYEYSRTMTFGISRTRYELTFNPDGGNWNGSTEPVKLVYVENAVITIYQAPTREGYTFVEWHGSSYQPGDSYTVTGAHTFTAVWRKNETAQAVVATGEDGRYLLRSMFFIACSAAIVLTMCIRKKKGES